MLDDLVEQVANDVYRVLQFSPESPTFANLTIEMEKRYNRFDKRAPTEFYVYEELAFVSETILQAQMLCGLMDVLLENSNPNPNREISISSDLLMTKVLAIGPDISQKIIQSAGIEVTKSTGWVRNLVADRLDSYGYLFNECFENYGKPHIEVARELRTAPRNHSVLEYQRAVAYYLEESLQEAARETAEGAYFPLLPAVISRYDALHSRLLAICDGAAR